MSTQLPDKKTGFQDPKYGMTRHLSRTDFAETLAEVKKALAEQGFGVLTEIDIKATFKKKLNTDFRDYVILGACNPPLAHAALSAELALGLLLPCNVVVAKEDNENIVVSTIDPQPMFEQLGVPEIEEIAQEVKGRLTQALTSLQ